jgi:hypothetical protein
MSFEMEKQVLNPTSRPTSTSKYFHMCVQWKNPFVMNKIKFSKAYSQLKYHFLTIRLKDFVFAIFQI